MYVFEPRGQKRVARCTKTLGIDNKILKEKPHGRMRKQRSRRSRICGMHTCLNAFVYRQC
jgi:hypothetical protein